MRPCGTCGASGPICGHGNRRVQLELEVELAELEAKRRAIFALSEAQAMAAYQPGQIAARITDGQMALFDEEVIQ